MTPPPLSSRYVWTTTPSTVQVTVNASPSVSCTAAVRDTGVPDGEVHSAVAAAGQLTVGGAFFAAVGSPLTHRPERRKPGTVAIGPTSMAPVAMLNR